jgi:hypothetical protein
VRNFHELKETKTGGAVRFARDVTAVLRHALALKAEKPHLSPDLFAQRAATLEAELDAWIDSQRRPVCVRLAVRTRRQVELRAKGYHPRVIVTDLNQDYTEPLAAVFPNAIHHECVFHALQYWHRCFKTTFGRDYERTHPNVFQLRRQVDRVFQQDAQADAQAGRQRRETPRLCCAPGVRRTDGPTRSTRPGGATPRTHFRQLGPPLPHAGQRL